MHARRPGRSGRWLALAAALCLGACTCTATGYEFHVRGVYEAPRSGFRMLVLGGGRVPAGHDVTDTGRAAVRICPTSHSRRPTLTLEVDTGGAQWKASSGAPRRGAFGWGWKQAPTNLQNRLDRLGYDELDPEELRETVGAIDGARAGPKGTRLDGQTSHLRVITTRLKRARGSLALSPCGTF